MICALKLCRSAFVPSAALSNMCAVIDAFVYQCPRVFSYPHMLLIGSRIKARLHNPNGLALVPHPEDKNSSLVLVADSGSHVVRKCPVRVCAHTCMQIDYTHAQKRWGLCVSLASNRRADMCICLRLCAWDRVCVGVRGCPSVYVFLQGLDLGWST